MATLAHPESRQGTASSNPQRPLRKVFMARFSFRQLI
jgi:hypothetical protein